MALLVVGGVVLLVGLIMTAVGWKDFQRRQRILNTPTTPVAHAHGQGVVEVSGRVVPSEQGVAVLPLSGRQGVYARVIVEEYRTRGRSGYWALLVNELDARSFFIDDGTGQARVLLENANVVIERSIVGKSGTLNDPSPQLAAFLRSRNVQTTNLLGFNRAIRVSEEAILPGQPIYALGPSRRDAGVPTNDAYRVGPSSQLVLFAAALGGAGELIVSNKTEADLVSKLLWGFLSGIILGTIGLLMTAGGVALLVADAL